MGPSSPPPVNLADPEMSDPAEIGANDQTEEAERKTENLSDLTQTLTLSDEDIEPLEDEVFVKLQDAVKRIANCYQGKDAPPAVSQLELLVQERDYESLRFQIADVWNALIGFHQKKGIRPHHQVTHAFNVIHGLVQQV